MRFVVCHLFGTATIGLVDCLLHGFGDGLCIHDGKSVNIAGCTSYNLNKRTVVAQKSLIISIENSHEGDFGNVESLAKKVDANEHVVGACTEVVDDVHTVEGVHIGMDVVGFDAHTVEKG